MGYDHVRVAGPWDNVPVLAGEDRTSYGKWIYGIGFLHVVEIHAVESGAGVGWESGVRENVLSVQYTAKFRDEWYVSVTFRSRQNVHGQQQPFCRFGAWRMASSNDYRITKRNPLHACCFDG